MSTHSINGDLVGAARRMALLASTAAVVLAPSIGHAQAAAPDNAIAEVVVTAQRREERLQDVPVAVTALGGEQMERLGIEGSKQLSQVTPGLNFTQSVYSPQPTIRGIGTRGVSPGDESVVPIYINGVYQPFIATADLQFNNIERIEVLKGPQGALFGRNATGGAINIITKRPDEGFQGAASLSYGRFNERIAKFYASGGTEKVAGDVAFVLNKDDGYIKDISRGEKYGSLDDASIRTQLRVTPTDNFTATLGLGHTSNADKTGSANQAFAGNSTARRFGSSVFLATEPYEVALSLPPYNKTIQNSASLVATLNLDGFDLTSVSGAQYNKLKAVADSDATPVQSNDSYVAQASRSVYQEVYATSTGDHRFNWIAGGVYYHDVAAQGPNVSALNGTRTRALNGALSTSDFRQTLRTSSWAAYVQATYDITDAIKATVGGRYSADDRSFRYQAIAPALLPLARGSKTFTKFTPSASIAWRVNDELNLYAKAGRAFKSGLFTQVTNVVKTVNPELVTQYELGFKSDPYPWLRLNGSTFYTDYKNVQTTARDPLTGASFLQNAASAKIYGVELETVVRPMSGLNLTGGISLLHAEYERFPGAQVFTPTAAALCPANTFPCGNTTSIQDASGKKLIRTPFFTANLGGDYTVPLSVGELVLSGNIYYAGHSYWDQINRLKEPSKTLVNAQITWNDPTDRYSVSLWGDNLLDQKYSLTMVNSTSDTQVFARPVTYGVKVDYRW